MKNTTYILDPGHNPSIKGKRSPGKPELIEYRFNELVCGLIADQLSMYNIKWKQTRSSFGILGKNIEKTLRQRVNIANETEGNACFISIHANAAGKSGWSKASGSKVFIAPCASYQSRVVANKIKKHLDNALPIPMREIGERRFTILTQTKCPAILIECGFMK